MTVVRFVGAGREFGARWVLREVSFTLAEGDRWGVVGRNGAGKTTLLKLLTGDDEPTEGEVWRHPGTRFGLLRQDRGEADSGTIWDAALAPFADLLATERRIEEGAARMATLPAGSPEADRLLREYDRDMAEFVHREGYGARARAEAALEGLGFAPSTWERPVGGLSGGELGRLRLLQTLLAEPDVLLLDEPTNHLDLRSTEWLEGYVRDYRGTVMVVSHDRAFLRRVCDHILHVESGTAVPYNGGLDAFVVQREERRARQLKEWEQQQGHIARTEEFIRRNLAGQKSKQAKSRRSQLAHLERVDRPEEEGRAMALRFGDAQRSGGTVLRLDGVSCGYGDRVLFPPFRAEVSRNERIALVGPNGSGKSTLVRVLAGERPPAAGAVTLGAGVRTAYYRQDLAHLDPNATVREEVAKVAPTLRMGELRTHLGRFLFSGDAIEARIGDLSGGERARVALARMTLEKVNLLLLDEPTNHLDLESCEALEAALLGFDGTVVLISHDRALLGACATRVWNVGPRGIEDVRGPFAEWYDRHRAQPVSTPADRRAPVLAASMGTALTSKGADPVQPEPAARPVISKNEAQRRQRELEGVESRIAQLEAELERLEASLADPALYAPGADASRVRQLTQARDGARTELERRFAEWERMGAELAGV